MWAEEVISKIKDDLNEDRAWEEYGIIVDLDFHNLMNINVLELRSTNSNIFDLSIEIKKKFYLMLYVDFSNFLMKMIVEFGVTQLNLTIEEDFSDQNMTQSMKAKLSGDIRRMLAFNEAELFSITIVGLGYILDELEIDDLDLRHLTHLRIVENAPNIVLGNNISINTFSSAFYLFVNNWKDLINLINYEGGSNKNEVQYEVEIYILAILNIDDFKGIIPVNKIYLNLYSNIPTHILLKILDLEKCVVVNLLYKEPEIKEHSH